MLTHWLPVNSYCRKKDSWHYQVNTAASLEYRIHSSLPSVDVKFLELLITGSFATQDFSRLNKDKVDELTILDFLPPATAAGQGLTLRRGRFVPSDREIQAAIDNLHLALRATLEYPEISKPWLIENLELMLQSFRDPMAHHVAATHD